jgi:hypothetical protein
MQIWLGKQNLGQTDTPQVQMTIHNEAKATASFTLDEETKKKLYEAAQLVRREATLARNGSIEPNGSN